MIICSSFCKPAVKSNIRVFSSAQTEEFFDTYFVVNTEDGEEIALKKNGSSIPVDNANKFEFAR